MIKTHIFLSIEEEIKKKKIHARKQDRDSK